MSDEELLVYCAALYESQGFDALTFQALKAHDNLYFTLFGRGISQRELIARLGLKDEFKVYRSTRALVRNGRSVQRWTWAHIVNEATTVQSRMGFLPPAAWFRANGQGALVQSVYYLGKTWEELRETLNDFHSSQFVESRNRMRWRSHPEASFSNFLYARGVEHRRGDRYPETYQEQSGRAYGVYDLHFKGRSGWADVEIWGEKPNGHGQANYANKRQEKEAFNAHNPNFLGVEFRDCYSDERLSALLAPYIGIIEPYVFDRPTDRLIESSHWSNADELLEVVPRQRP